MDDAEVFEFFTNIFGGDHAVDQFVDLMLVCHVFGYRKDNLKRLIIKHLVVNSDYTSERMGKKETIKLSVDGVLQLCNVMRRPDKSRLTELCRGAQQKINAAADDDSDSDSDSDSESNSDSDSDSYNDNNIGTDCDGLMSFT